MLSSTRFIYSQFEWLPKGFLNVAVRHYTAPESDLGVVIPNRLQRGPTDILKALASTVGKDPTAFHYKYPDDPYFYAYNNSAKRQMALSLESGRKSAKWVMNTNPQLFNSKIADPAIKEFIPKTPLDKISEVTEPMLVGAIKSAQVSDAIEIYNMLKEKEINVSDETKLMLLQLVCFYNCNNRENENELELKWFKSGKVDHKVKTWLDNGFAETLFQTMNQDCPLACSAIIMGRLKYNQVEKGSELYNLAKEKKMKLTVGVYNNLILQASNLAETMFKRWAYIESFLNEMQSLNIWPNLGTLNAVLKVSSQARQVNSFGNYLKQIVNEFARIGIQPSLGSYTYLIPALCKTFSNSHNVSIFRKIIEDLREVDLTIRHPSDMQFFPTIMHFCSKVMKNAECARLLNSLLSTRDNIKFLSGNFDETFYYKCYLTVLFNEEPIEDAMQVYRSLVPCVYSPEFFVFQTCLMAVKRYEAFDAMVEIWQSMKNQSFSHSIELIKLLLEMITLPKDAHDDEVLRVFHEAASSIFTSITKEDNSYYLQLVDPPLVTNTLEAFIMCDHIDKAVKFFQAVKTNLMFLDIESVALVRLMDYCLTKNRFSDALDCLRYAETKNHADLQKMAAEALPKFSGASSEDLKFVKSLAEKKEEGEVESS